MITLEQIIKKHETNINTENMSKKLREKILFSDTQEAVVQDDIKLTDIKAPQHETDEDGIESYTYKFKDYTLEITFNPQNYKTMDVTLSYPTPEDVPEPAYVHNWNYKGEIGLIV